MSSVGLEFVDEEFRKSDLLNSIFQYSPIGLVLIDSNANLIRVNDYMFELFQFNPDSVYGKKFGNVFNCSSIFGSEKLCGESDFCKNCELSKGIKKVFLEKKLLQGIELSHLFTLNNRSSEKWFKVSAAPIKDKDSVYALFTFVDITDRINLENSLRSMGVVDSLTNLFNRRYLTDYFESNFLSDLANGSIGLMIIDIDNFKSINDSYGHTTGDLVLKIIAQAIASSIRNYDFSIRYGGEEFIIVFQNVNRDNIEVIGKRIQNVFMKRTKEIIDKEVTFSAGYVIVSNPDLSINPTELIKIADSYMYQVKSRGKNNIMGISLKSKHY